ncbi:CDP-diacylglycerol--serine O-phosphatidyltransferase [Flavobacterium glaciei]|uniref:CDP-diacylglycerol--serine O-phosphatidyltransferase n=1 Tax=Flavobacterium glaciei TaxID=386300 RepID=A0A562Q5R1_9FLAO|nr:CDP-diacylglycerol--serine O-phosphatidyltransferase [Flavobacterium glaciei]TWI52095.1 CDP-diacylglycerol--serine O-phosphatidyltransferase [Flavobacterium glaciei]
MTIKKHIPNIITLLNLFCGCIALVFAFNQNFEMAFFFVCLGIFLDFFDGFFARLFNVSSPLGLQLDSLADMVTSGVVPGLVMSQMMIDNSSTAVIGHLQIFPYLGFLITLGSCFRLANFNIDTRQTDSFIGLPTPANALFILSLPLVLKYTESIFVIEILTNQWVLLAISILSAYILNAEIPLFSLKIKKFNFKDNTLQIVFLICSLLLLIFLEYLGIPLVILFYVLLSVVNNKVSSRTIVQEEIVKTESKNIIKMKVIFTSLYGIFIITAIITHIWTVIIAFTETGFFSGILSLFLPFLAEIYWMFKMFGINNLYACIALTHLILAIPFSLFGRKQ